MSGETTVSSGNSEKVSSQEYERMRGEVAKVKVERGILKKVLATARPTSR